MAIQILRRAFCHCGGMPRYTVHPVPLKRRFLSSGLWVCAVAVQAGTGSASAQQCPDLAGTYAVSQTAWIDAFHLHVTGTVRPKGQAPQLATLRPRDGGYTLTWHMPRNGVLAAANRLSERDPRIYGLWLDMALRDPPALSSADRSEQEWFNRVAFLGPVFRVDVALPILPLLPHTQCEGGWFLVGTHGRSGPPDMPGGMEGERDAQLALQRRNDGGLALRWRERRKLVVIARTRYTSESAIPLPWSTHVAYWPAAAAPDLTPLREDELPARGGLPKCRVVTAQESEFFKRLDGILPAQAVQTNRSRGGLYIGRMRADGTCEPMPYYVTITALSAADLTTAEAFLKTDPFFARMESQQSEARPDGRLTRIFKMVVVP